MRARYSGPVPRRHPLPLVWLLSDARNDACLADTLVRLPPASGFVFRHYHLDAAARAARFRELAALARSHGHMAVLAGDSATARTFGADGAYGALDEGEGSDAFVRLATAHNGDELQAALRARADGVFLSPVFPTRSHPGMPVLGVHGFAVLAQQSPIPVIALGGMNAARARQLNWPRWGAIDGL
jgi:thiamine-phosphate pyrophosphorylase